MPENQDWIHPLDEMANREPLGNASVRVIVMATENAARAEEIGIGLVRLLSGRGRKASSIVVRADVHGWNRALEQGLSESAEPIVIVTTASAPWGSGHLDPILKAIDERDHVIGRRPRSGGNAIGRFLRSLLYRFLFAVPVVDVFSPIRIHRREKLVAIPLQSGTRFLDVEILAKATFLVQTIEEVDVPDLPSPDVGPLGHDLAKVFRHPTLKPGEDRERSADLDSGPAEPPKGESERADSPGREDGEGGQDLAVEQARAFEHDSSQGVEELR